MPRQNLAEIAAAVAVAKVEGFEEAQELVEKLLASGLSLNVARTALDERAGELLYERTAALAAAEATRAPAEKPKKRARRASAPVAEPLPDPAPPAGDPLPDPAAPVEAPGEIIGGDGLRVDPPVCPEPDCTLPAGHEGEHDTIPF